MSSTHRESARRLARCAQTVLYICSATCGPEGAVQSVTVPPGPKPWEPDCRLPTTLTAHEILEAAQAEFFASALAVKETVTPSPDKMSTPQRTFIAPAFQLSLTLVARLRRAAATARLPGRCHGDVSS